MQPARSRNMTVTKKMTIWDETVSKSPDDAIRLEIALALTRDDQRRNRDHRQQDTHDEQRRGPLDRRGGRALGGRFWSMEDHGLRFLHQMMEPDIARWS